MSETPNNLENYDEESPFREIEKGVFVGDDIETGEPHFYAAFPDGTPFDAIYCAVVLITRPKIEGRFTHANNRIEHSYGRGFFKLGRNYTIENARIIANELLPKILAYIEANNITQTVVDEMARGKAPYPDFGIPYRKINLK